MKLLKLLCYILVTLPLLLIALGVGLAFMYVAVTAIFTN